MKNSKKSNSAYVECWFNEFDPEKKFLIFVQFYGESRIFYSKYNSTTHKFERNFVEAKNKEKTKMRHLLTRNYAYKYDEYFDSLLVS